jgi:hypothetical protein
MMTRVTFQSGRTLRSSDGGRTAEPYQTSAF